MYLLVISNITIYVILPKEAPQVKQTESNTNTICHVPLGNATGGTDG